jgi:probable F420-dependent oxidoreductase
MALKDTMEFGFVLPCRSWDPIAIDEVRRVAQRADELGFSDLWVTENSLDSDAYSFDPFVALSYAAAITTRIRLGVSVVVLPLHSPIHVAHSTTTLDQVSGGRAILGVGLGRTGHYGDFGNPVEHRVSRFIEGVDVIKALWTKPKAGYKGNFYTVEHGMALKPVQKPHPPLWLDGAHPNTLPRAARIADGWMGAGGSSWAELKAAIPALHQALAKYGKNPASFPISKRIFMSVHERPEVAKAELLRWFGDVYHNPQGIETHGFYGTPEQAREYIEEAQAMGATHLLLNPIIRYEEQLEALAEVVGYK